jgi:ATP-binding cassette, subfamily B, bacterial
MQNPYLKLFYFSWKYTQKGDRMRLIAVYACFFTAILLGTVIPLLHGWFVNALQTQEDKILFAWLYVFSYGAVTLVQWVLTAPARLTENRLAFNMGRNFLSETFHYLLHLPLEWHKEEHSGAMNNRVRRGYNSLKQFFQDGYVYLATVIQLLTSVAAMIYFQPSFGLIAIGIGLVALWINKKFDKPFIDSFNASNEAEHKVMGVLTDSLSNIFTVRTLRAEQSMQQEVMSKLVRIFSPLRRSVLINEWRWIVLNFMILLIFLVTFMGYMYANYRHGEIFYLGGLVTLLAYVAQFTGSFFNVTGQYTEVVRYSADLGAVKDIREAYYKQNISKPAGALPGTWKTIEVEQLNFVYTQDRSPDLPRGREPVLDVHADCAACLEDVFMTFNHGEKVAVIGESGAGKSTLLALIRGLYKPASVRVMVDGQEVEWETLNQGAILFPQEVEIFENTVLFNLTLGMPFEKEDVIRACEIACFLEVVNDLPDGFESIIHEKGINLSGGQKQRLALARGILASAPFSIILLDEPTSSLDPVTEARVYRNLLSSLSEKCFISTVHNRALLAEFDRVYQLERGKVIDEATPHKFVSIDTDMVIKSKRERL